jgi:hypothetical protein
MRAIKTAMVLAVTFLGIFAGSARAQERVVVKVPFKFMMRGQEFSAGRYGISREGFMLAVRGMDNGSGGFALAVPADGQDPAGDQPALVFTRGEDGREYELSEIWESDTEGLAIPEPSAASHHSKAPEASIVVPASSSK